MSHIILQCTIDDIVDVGVHTLLYKPVDIVTGKYVTIKRNAPESFIVTFKHDDIVLASEPFYTLDEAIEFAREYIRANAGELLETPF